MGKRSFFERRERDFYETPMEAVLPLLPHLKPATKFAEICAGAGKLVGHLESHGHKCVAAFDIEPMNSRITRMDAMFMDAKSLNNANAIITNPPWERTLLHGIINRCVVVGKPAWLLFDADWVHTRQAVPFMPHLSAIVSVGRVKWIDGSKMSGKDNSAWHLFSPKATNTIHFHGRLT